MTFYEWLMTQVDRDDPIGDFAQDVKRDKKFPKTVKTRIGLLRHITGADSVVIETARKAWGKYEQR